MLRVIFHVDSIQLNTVHLIYLYDSDVNNDHIAITVVHIIIIF